MASSLTNYSNLINVNFPIPGADNDTQGFRNNFSKIQSALTVASDEISAIQVNSVNLSSTNDFGYNVIKRAALQAEGQIVNDETAGISSEGLAVDYSLGSYQRFRLDSGTNTISVINWPSGSADDVAGKVRLELELTSNFPTNILISGAAVISHTTSPVTYNATGTVIWDVWSPDSGISIYAAEANPDHLKITGSGNVYAGEGTTSMTDGFFYIPSAAGAPTGTPTSITNTVPMYYDSTNNRFYVYNGAWKKVNLT